MPNSNSPWYLRRAPFQQAHPHTYNSILKQMMWEGARLAFAFSLSLFALQVWLHGYTGAEIVVLFAVAAWLLLMTEPPQYIPAWVWDRPP
jgi:hypothetical protein